MKQKDDYSKRYIFDALYGKITLPEYVWPILTVPELQRLREVRLCNINSLDLTGGSNINRYEHAIGTAYLASITVSNWPFGVSISEDDKRLIVLSALLHDVVNGAFGHSFEYVEVKQGFKHEGSLADVVFGNNNTEYNYKISNIEPIFFGMPMELIQHLNKIDLVRISNIISGKDRFSPLISGTMDLDNIDNVYRLSYHIGIVNSGDIPVKLASTMWANENKLFITKSGENVITKWLEVRQQLYDILLLNPQEFSGKYMLNEAIEISKEEAPGGLTWHLVDFEFLEKLKDSSSQCSIIIKRLMKGELYGCLTIFESDRVELYERLSKYEVRIEVEKELNRTLKSRLSKSTIPKKFHSIMLGYHIIKDLNKTDRQVIYNDEFGMAKYVGEKSKRLYFGVFLKNVEFNINNIDKIPSDTRKAMVEIVKNILIDITEDGNIGELELYMEAKKFGRIS